MENKPTESATFAKLARRPPADRQQIGRSIGNAMTEHGANWSDVMPVYNPAAQYGANLTVFACRVAGLSVTAMATRLTQTLLIFTCNQVG